MRRTLILVLACTLGAAAAPAVFGAEPIDFTADGARVVIPEHGGGLTVATKAAPAGVVAGFLATKRGLAADSLAVVSEHRVERTGVTHLRMKQEVGGLEVYGTYAKAAVDGSGRLVHLIENLVPAPKAGVERAVATSADALDAALRHLHPLAPKVGLTVTGRDGDTVTFSKAPFFYRGPRVKRVAIPMDDGTVQEGFLVETWTDKENLLHHTLVGRFGDVLAVELHTNTDSYNIFPEEPESTPQQIVNGPGTGNAESPIGWVFSSGQTTVDISGNNVHAYLDTDANDSPDPGGTAVTDANFVTAADLTLEPEDPANQEVAVQNLFYLNNVIHDKLYRHGFVEAVGNFQEDNFGNGGLGSDSVNAEGQDGSGTNNANFSTPSDGSNPRMQMFVWTQSTPKRDGDVDSDIVYHEYGHGLTWRMIGSMSGPMSGAVGEGMSDALSVLINLDDVLAEYSFNDPLGIRSAPYTDYPRTYGDFTGDSVHFDGEIYAAIAWRMGELFDQNAVPRDTLFDYIVDGMNFTPAGPAYEDMRDGILQSASGSGHECLIWEAFAAYGVGVGAEGSVKGGGPFGGGNVEVTESFELPPECSGCTVTEDPEVSCSDGVDNDCDGLTDADDTDCGAGACIADGESCSKDGDCCSGNCSNGPPSSRVCQ